VPTDGLPIDAQLPGDVPVGPAGSRKSQNCLYFRHLELIRHRPIRLRQKPKANGNGQISSLSKWLVLARPSVAGFARPMTVDQKVRSMAPQVNSAEGCLIAFSDAFGVERMLWRDIVLDR
jgi:hypothetical protein